MLTSASVVGPDASTVICSTTLLRWFYRCHYLEQCSNLDFDSSLDVLARIPIGIFCLVQSIDKAAGYSAPTGCSESLQVGRY